MDYQDEIGIDAARLSKRDGYRFAIRRRQMKMVFSKQVYDQFDDASREGLKPIACDCIKSGKPQTECEYCSGSGTVYETTLSAEESAAIQENLRTQGVPLGKMDTN